VNYGEEDVTTHDDALDPALLVAVLKDIRKLGFQFGWHSNKGVDFSHWNINYGGSKKLRFDIRPKMPRAVGAVWDALIEKRIMCKEHRPIRAYVNAMTFGTEGYPHTDTQVASDTTVVVYLNPEWKADWAGETVFFDSSDDVVKAVLPRFGRVSVFPGNMLHAARGLSRICPEARYVLVFKAAVDE
jgi:hypothetical protein